MIHMKFGSKSKSIRLDSARPPVWTRKSRPTKLQKTTKGYYQMTISKELKESLQWPDDAVLDQQIVDGMLVVANIRR